MATNEICKFCGDLAAVIQLEDLVYKYSCDRCGEYNVERRTKDDLLSEIKDQYKRKIISIVLRNEYERSGKASVNKILTLGDFNNIIKNYREKDVLEILDIALQKIEARIKSIGQIIKIDVEKDYPFFYCQHPKELREILKLLLIEGLIYSTDTLNPQSGLQITSKGYVRLRELRKIQPDSRKCFVAMWFTPEMNQVYDSTIKPAIEYIEEGEDSARYEAVKIDKVPHLNDINDEIIAQIRRCKFMVCDLTGYRGGVYFEAGFAKGLGIPIIYTCRKDWLKPEMLYDKTKKQVKGLYDGRGKKIEIKKEGVHFDIDHMNRIEWENTKAGLEKFKEDLTTTIKANII